MFPSTQLPSCLSKVQPPPPNLCSRVLRPARPAHCFYIWSGGCLFRNLQENMLYANMIWYDMIWYDMIWYDMTWHDMIWYDMINIYTVYIYISGWRVTQQVVLVFWTGNVVQAVLMGGQVDGEKSSQKVDWFAGRSDLGTIAPRFEWVCFSPHTPKKWKKATNWIYLSSIHYLQIGCSISTRETWSSTLKTHKTKVHDCNV